MFIVCNCYPLPPISKICFAQWQGSLTEKTIFRTGETKEEILEALKDAGKEDLLDWIGSLYEHTDILKVAKPSKHKEHPTAKPVALYEKFIRNSSEHGARVYDPFAGSGVIFIAAEKAGRVGYGVELDPEYAYNILKRWEEYSDEAPILEETGETHSFVTVEEE